MKNKLWLKKSLLLLAIIIAVAVAVEFLLFSFKGIFLDKDECLLNYEVLTDKAIELEKAEDFTYSFKFPSQRVFNLRIGSVSKNGAATYFHPIDIEIFGQDTKLSNYHIHLKNSYLSPGKTDTNYQNVELDLNISEGSQLYIKFSNVKADTVINSITVNSTKNLIGLNPVRLAVFILMGLVAWACVVFNLNKEYFNIKSKKHRTVSIITVALCLVITFLFCNFSVGFRDYPLENLENASPYAQQFDAFLKGSLSLDIEVPEELTQLENPYDYSLREDIDYLWDRAMYDGKYYSYFGIAPIINVYAPFYLLTGGLPCDEFVVVFYALLATLFTVLFIYEFIIIFKKRVHVWFISLSCFTIIFSSGILFMTRCAAAFYHIAVLSAMAYLMMFLFFILLAVRCRHKIIRPVLFAISSLSYALLFLSRVNIAFLCALFVLPILYFCMIKGDYSLDCDRELKVSRSFKEKIIDFSCLASFVTASLIFTFIYNYLRFDNIFEFGTSYQLTVSDISQNSISPFSVSQMIYHTLFQQFSVNGAFPFFTMEELNLGDYGGFLYTDPNFGLFAIPLMMGLLFSVYTLFSKKKTLFSKILVVCLYVGIVSICILNFEMGGVIFRYTCDLTLICAVASVLFMISFNESVEHSDGHSAVIKIEAILMLVSIFVCFNVLTSYLYSFFSYDADIFMIFYNLFN